MKKVSRILYLVGGITSAIAILESIIFGITCILGPQFLVDVIMRIVSQSGTIPSADVEQIKQVVGIVLIICAIYLFISVIPQIICTVLGFRGFSGKNKGGANIASIILGFVFSCNFMIPAGILGLISDKLPKSPEVVAEYVE